MGDLSKEVILPIALEKVLALTDVRIHQIGFNDEELRNVQRGNSRLPIHFNDSLVLFLIKLHRQMTQSTVIDIEA